MREREREIERERGRERKRGDIRKKRRDRETGKGMEIYIDIVASRGKHGEGKK